MKVTFLAFLALATAACASVLSVPIAKGGPGQISRRHPLLTKRASYVEDLVNNITGGGYYASVSVGTPGQSISMVLDTGSSDALVISSGADLCTSALLQTQYGTTCYDTYNSSRSSSYKLVSQNGFSITYLDGSGAAGDYIKDNFEVGGATVEALQMGLAKTVTSSTSILGIGFSANEAARHTYPNLVDAMVNQKLVSTRAYSLYLNDYASSTGSVLFGGIDTDKFIGAMVSLPILPDSQSQNYTSFTIGMSALSLAFANGTTFNSSITGAIDAVLDSGTTLSYLPNNLASPLFNAVGAYTYTELGESLALVDCGLLDASQSPNFTFRFNNTATITVAADELVLDILNTDVSSIPPEIPFTNPCVFGIQNSGDALPSGRARQIDFALLGDTFLRSAFVVYDIANLQIGMAQANLNSTSSNLVDLQSGSLNLAQYTGVSSQQEQPSATGTSSSNSVFTGTTSTSSSRNTASGAGLTTSSSSAGSTASASGSASAALGRPSGGWEGFALVAITTLFAMSGGAIFLWQA